MKLYIDTNLEKERKKNKLLNLKKSLIEPYAGITQGIITLEINGEEFEFKSKNVPQYLDVLLTGLIHGTAAGKLKKFNSTPFGEKELKKVRIRVR